MTHRHVFYGLLNEQIARVILKIRFCSPLMSLDPSILHALLSPDGAQRGAAEAAYEQAKAASPEAVASGLLACLPVGAQPDGVRIMAAVLLRQFVDNKRPQWAAMSPQVRIMHVVHPFFLSLSHSI